MTCYVIKTQQLFIQAGGEVEVGQSVSHSVDHVFPHLCLRDLPAP